MLLITPITIGILYYIEYITHRQPVIYAQIFSTWFVIYYLGILVKLDKIKLNGLEAACGTLIGLYLMNIESTYINEVLDVQSWAASQIKFSSFFYSISLCFLFMALHCELKRNVVVRLGEYSFGIFLIHLPVKMAIEKMVSCLMPMNSPIWQALVITLTLAICWVVIEVSNRVLPEKLNRYLGFR